MLKFSLICLFILSAFGFQMAPKAVQTTFISRYPDTNLGGQSIYIRGDSCNLTWAKGAILTRTALNEWKIALSCPEGTAINVKLLLNDTNWMFGNNKVFIGGTNTV